MSERRHDPLNDRWVIVSPGRNSRPWQGESATPVPPTADHWRGDCYLCPRNTRSSGTTNPDYRGVYVFDNDYPGLPTSHAATGPADGGEGLLQRQAVTGRCRVLCYSHQHQRSLADFDHDELTAVVAAWQEEHAMLSADYPWVQIFENKGRMMGCSSDHPHGQIWASSHLPSTPSAEDRSQHAYLAAHLRPLLLDYVNHEIALGIRVVAANDRWAAVVPYWAAWPFELLLMPTRHREDFQALGAADQSDLTFMLHRVLRAYDALFGVAMPYSMGWHGRPSGGGGHWQLHAHFYPPLLRSASIRKFMVGYEMLAEPQRDLTPEEAAARLRERLP